MKTLLALSAAFMLGAPASAALLYDAHSCTPGISCAVTSHGSSLGTGPSNADFQSFFAANLGFDTSADTFTWTASSNANGYFFGNVSDSQYAINTSYLWNSSGVICCTIDEPYAIADGNDHNLFIGSDIYGQSGQQYLWAEFIANPGGTFALTGIPLQLTPQAYSMLGADLISVQFLAIDNSDRILARWSQGWLEFDPASSSNPGIPEPATALLALPLLLLLRRRSKLSR
ncbi:hypothetical protein FHS83_003029 [Rhizomicrobium palustre]|uniref:PEP-CTERM sorting domain-containing protein n=1 Tax=Rhizomicrobium palustre TaxID=189966 RepID=A0A846N354_9PROT|nr:hypothetical protein [Rhizomicrobium palustre]NIK89711.1 hypothetical protein [Rhizomicrobium palustre]